MTKLFKIEKLDFLISFYITCVVLSEVMGAKTFPLLNMWGFHLNATVAIFILPLLYSINDMVIEVYGKERAQSIVRSSLAIILFILLFSVLATSLPASTRFLPTENAYDTIFGKAIRFSAASLIAFIISEFADIYIFSKLRERLGKTKLWLRTNASNFLSEFLDVLVFMTLAFYAFDQSFVSNFSFIASIGLPYYFLRCFMSVITTPLVYVGVKWLRKK